MYAYYEHHKTPDGKIVLTELRLSSYSNGVLKINFKSKSENVIFDALKPLLKFPPIANYSYEPVTKIWSYLGSYGVNCTYGEEVLKKLEAVSMALGTAYKAIPVIDLAAQAVYDKVDLSLRTGKLKAEDFFYNHGTAVAAPVLTKETLEQKLCVLIGTAPDKKSYRQAALRFHPDRNNGDGSKMSELNMLWQLWKLLL